MTVRKMAAILLGAALAGTAWAVPPEVKISPIPLMASPGSVGVAASNLSIASGAAFIYRAGFSPARWSGSLRKFGVTLVGDGLVQIDSTPRWDAAEILSGANGKAAFPEPAGRKIYTARIESGELVTVEFKWDDLSEAQRDWINTSPLTGRGDGLGMKRVEYLRGDRDLERGKADGVFRARDGVLGDIVGSSPVFAGPPAMNVPGGDYQTFLDAYKNRSGAVYVGANDGMLHAFDAGSGRELFAYMPNALVRSLNWLTHPEYTHRPYVDGGIFVAEARVAGSWRTILAAGMGGGAQGVFALDVTDPADFMGGKGALWEFTDSDDADMGNVLGAPVIARFKTKVVDGKPEYRYFAVVGSGLNNYKDDGAGKFNPAAPGVLFLLSIDKHPREKWKLNVNYFKFKTAIKDRNRANGLSSPALAIGDGGAVRYAYAGDLQGNMWRFDFTGTMPWSKAKPGDTPLFTATDDRRIRQPVTTQPKIVFAPGGGYVVLFGTGKFVEEADTAAAWYRPQSFYGIYDTTLKSYSVYGRSELEPRLLEGNDGDAMRVGGKPFVLGAIAGKRKGWYLDFLESEKTGERVVADPATAYGRVFFNSLIPCGDPCSTERSRYYSLDALTGLPEGEAATVASNSGPTGTPMIFEVGTVVGIAGGAGKESVRKRYTVVNFGADGPGNSTGGGASDVTRAPPSQAILPARRFSWREVLNWQELRDALAGK